MPGIPRRRKHRRHPSKSAICTPGSVAIASAISLCFRLGSNYDISLHTQASSIEEFRRQDMATDRVIQ